MKEEEQLLKELWLSRHPEIQIINKIKSRDFIVEHDVLDVPHFPKKSYKMHFVINDVHYEFNCIYDSLIVIESQVMCFIKFNLNKDLEFSDYISQDELFELNNYINKLRKSSFL